MHKYIKYVIVVILVSQLKLKNEKYYLATSSKIYIENAVFVYGCSFGELQWPDGDSVNDGCGGSEGCTNSVPHTPPDRCSVRLWGCPVTLRVSLKHVRTGAGQRC